MYLPNRFKTGNLRRHQISASTAGPSHSITGKRQTTIGPSNVEQNTDEKTLSPPDGGRMAWITVAGSFCLLFVSFGWVTCIGVFQDYYQAQQLKTYAPSSVAWVASIETCVVFLWGPFIGKLFDNYGPRYLVLIGAFLHVFGLMMLSLCTQYYQFILAQSMCSGTGASVLFFTGTTAVSTWFTRRRALALGITVSGSSLGGIIFPIMVDHLFPRLGFPWTLRVCAFLVLVFSILASLTVRSRLQHTPTPFRLRDYWRPLRESAAFSSFTAGYFLFYMGFFIPYNFVILEAERYGVPAELATYLISILNAGGMIGRIAPGWVADRVGRLNVMVIVTVFSAAMVLGLWIPGRGSGAILTFCVLYGFSSGAFISLAPAILAQISPLQELGARQGTCFVFISVASLVGNPIAGALVRNTSVDPFWKLQLFAGIMMVGGGVMITIARVAAGGLSLKTVI